MIAKIMRLPLHWQIVLALVLAVIVGISSGQHTVILGVNLLDIYSFFGTLFLNALKMLIVPLIVSSIIVGISGIGDSSALGRLGGKTILYYMTTSFIAISIGLVLVNVIQPGVGAKEEIGLTENIDEITAKVEDKGAGDIAGIFLRLVPVNVVAAAAEGQMLGLIFFSLLFGYFMTQIKKERGEPLKNFWQGIFDIMMLMTDWVMKFAPIGVFSLVAKVIAISGLDVFRPLAWFFMTVVLALGIHLLIVMPLLLKVFAKVNPLLHFKAMAPALLTAFSTSSSSATLPITMECVEKNAGVSNQTTSFVLPLGATINMDGTALYECVAAMFIAQAYGLDLSVAQQFSVVLIALLTSIGVAGIPSASLVAISIILAAIGLPLEAVGLILAVDRILDMCRTSVNVFSDSCGAVIIARIQGETNLFTK